MRDLANAHRVNGGMTDRFWRRIALQPQALNPRLRSKVRRSFLAYAGLLLLIGWAYALWYVYEDRLRTVAVANEQLLAVANSLVIQMEATLADGLGSAESALTHLRNSGTPSQMPASLVQARLRKEVTGDYIRALFVGSPERTVVAGRAGIEAESQGIPTWLPRVPRAGQTVVGTPMPDPLREGHTLIPIAQAETGGTQEPTWLGMWFDVSELLDRYQSIGIDRGAISILASDGWLLAGTAVDGRSPALTDVRTTELFRRISLLSPGQAQVMDGVSAVDGKRKLFSVAKVGENSPLILAVSREYQAIVAPWRRNSITVLWLSLGSSALLIAMTVLLYRSLHEIHRRESQFQKLFENSLASILLMKEGRIVEKNARAMQGFQVPESKTLIGRRFEEISAEVQEDGTPSAVAIARLYEELKREGGRSFGGASSEWTPMRLSRPRSTCRRSKSPMMS